MLDVARKARESDSEVLHTELINPATALSH